MHKQKIDLLRWNVLVLFSSKSTKNMHAELYSKVYNRKHLENRLAPLTHFWAILQSSRRIRGLNSKYLDLSLAHIKKNTNFAAQSLKTNERRIFRF